jgi:hypothetical protein
LKPAAENDGLLRAIKIHSMISFGMEIKPSAHRQKVLQHVKIPAENDRDASPAKFNTFLDSFLSNSLFGVSATTRYLVHESGMIRTQKRKIDQKMAEVTWDALYHTTP